MKENFFFVFQQVLILCGLISVGFISGRTKLIPEASEQTLASLTLYLSMPSVIVSSFQRPFNQALLNGFWSVLLITLAMYAFTIFIAHLTLSDRKPGYQKLLRFSAVFSNCGFMALPLAQSLYGEVGVFYSGIIVAIFNLFLWTYGYILMSEGHAKLPVRELLLNPGIIALIIGLLLFSFSVTLPKPVSGLLQQISGLNTPLGMFVIGSRLSHADLRKLFVWDRSWLATVERLIIFPLSLIGVLACLSVRGTAAVVCVIASCAPAASTATMFAILFHHDENASANLVSLQTILAALTMPVLVSLAQTLLG